jgi:hypothetical protein
MATWVLCASLLYALVLAEQPTPSGSTNYASAYLGAQVVEHSPEIRGARNLLRDSDDYMIVRCDVPKKRFTIQLSREVSIRSVVLVNREYFSSIIERFTLLGANQFPCVGSCRWMELGNFAANFTRDRQTFELVKSLDDPVPVVRYLRLLWVTHYGKERHCTLTTLHVYGHDRWEIASSLPNLLDGVVPDDDENSEHDANSNSNVNMSHAASVYLKKGFIPPWWTSEFASLSNASCPASTLAQDMEGAFEALATCPQRNSTKLVVPAPIYVLGDAIGTHRSILALRKNMSAVFVKLSESAVTIDQLARVVAKEAQDARGHTRVMHREIRELKAAFAEMRAELILLRSSGTWAIIAFSTAIVICLLLALLSYLAFSAKRVHRHRRQPTTGLEASDSDESDQPMLLETQSLEDLKHATSFSPTA